MITAEIETPTIGIGAGPDCDGQVLVFHDILNLTFGPPAKFVRRYADAAAFFFQAEDGIRDTSVTGVQTCALPIWARLHVVAGQHRQHPGERARPARVDPDERSEERRVGKECRSRWSPYH